LAGYLSKYITKEMGERVEFTHRYRRSRNIVGDERVEEFEEADMDRVMTTAFIRFGNCGARFILRGDAFRYMIGT
jgi:hypothetical protein